MFSINVYHWTFNDLDEYRIVIKGNKYTESRNPVLYVVGLNLVIAMIGTILGIVYTGSIKNVLKKNSKLK